MRRNRASRWTVVIAAILAAAGLGPLWQDYSPGGTGQGGPLDSLAARWRGGLAQAAMAQDKPDRKGEITLTVSVHGTARCTREYAAGHGASHPGGAIIVRQAAEDNVTVFYQGIARYRIDGYLEDDGQNGGPSFLYTRIESVCTGLGASGSGYKSSDEKWRDKWWKRHESWINFLRKFSGPLAGPYLDFKKDEFKVVAHWWVSADRKGAATYDSSEYPSSRKQGLSAGDYASLELSKAFGQATKDKKFQSQMTGRLDWLKRGSISGSASSSVTSETPHLAGGEPVGKSTGQASFKITWTVSFEPPAVEMDLIPQGNYEKWLPRGGSNEDTPGSTFTVNIDIHKPGQPGVAPQAEVKGITVWLADTSNQPGVCMNYPKPGKESQAKYDFQIRPNDDWTVTEKGQRAQANKPGPQGAVVLNCYDYGGWTRLMATAELADGSHVVGRVKGKTETAQLAVPKDDNENRIADCWERSPAYEDAFADDDDKPAGNGVAGDGLSVFEEYRGFKCQGRHIRTHPTDKDLFIYDRDNLGIGMFGLSGLTTHLVREEEYAEEGVTGRYGDNNPNVINFNRGHATAGAQHLLTMHRIFMDPRRAGFTQYGPPRCVQGVYISKQTSEDSLPSVIAHELGHACSIEHHGERDYEACDMSIVVDGEVSDLPGGHVEQGSKSVAARGGQHSGVEDCIMRYRVAELYEKPDGPWAWHKAAGKAPWIRGDYWPTNVPNPPRTHFCTQKDGKTFNDPARPGGPLAGSAPRGDCLHRIQVNDHQAVPQKDFLDRP